MKHSIWRRVSILALAAMLAAGVAGCGGSEENSASESIAETTAVTETEATTEATTAVVTTTETTTTTEATTTVEESSAEETETEEGTEAEKDIAEAAGTYDSTTGLYETENYSLTADPEVWNFDDSAGYPSFTYRSDDYFETATAFNVITASSDAMENMDVLEFIDSSLRSNYEEMENCTLTDVTEGQLNGMKTYNYTITYVYEATEEASVNMIVNQVVFQEDDMFGVITYGGLEGYTENAETAIQNILNSMQLK